MELNSSLRPSALTQDTKQNHSLSTVTILALRDTISEHDNLGGLLASVLLEQGNVSLEHPSEIRDDLLSTFLETDRGDELSILAVDGGDGDGNGGRDGSTTGRRVGNVGADHHCGLVKLKGQLMVGVASRTDKLTADVTGTKWVTPPILA